MTPEFRVLTREEIATVPGISDPLPSSFMAVGAVDEEGVVAACGVFLVVHADPIWIRPDKRNHGRLLYRLWEATKNELLRQGLERFEVGMTDTNPGEPTESLVERMCLAVGGYEIAGRFFAVPVSKEA